MPTFGFSAFLKLISLNTRPQRALVRQRTGVLKSEGYDYHRSLKLRAAQFLHGRLSLEEALLSTEEIKRKPERNSAKSGLEQLARWRVVHSGQISTIEPVIFESPAKNFRVQFLPNFGVELDGQIVATHIWNTQRPSLDARMVYGALSFILPLYIEKTDRPNDLAVLSLPDLKFYRLGEAGDLSEVGNRTVRRLDDLFEQVRRETDKPGGPDDRPPPVPLRPRG